MLVLRDFVPQMVLDEGPIAQWQSAGLIIPGLQVRILLGPLLRTREVRRTTPINSGGRG